MLQILVRAPSKIRGLAPGYPFGGYNMLQRRTSRTQVAHLALSLIAGSLFGCGGGSGGGGGNNGNGTLSVVMTDCADPTVSALDVTISRVEAHVGNDWVTITSVPKSFNLFDLVRE